MSEQRSVSEMAHFEWVSVSQYLQYLEVQANLIPFCISEVYSFRVTDTGFVGLADRKTRLKDVLEANLKGVERWVRANKDSMEETERVFARSVWCTTKNALEMVQEHIIRARLLEKHKQVYTMPLGVKEESSEELPF